MENSENSRIIDDKEKTVTIVLNPRLYPQSVIMRAAYRFTEDFDVSVDGDPLDKITAVFKVRAEDKKDADRKDLEEIADTFYNELLHASVEETQARRYADTRNALIGAAVRSLVPNISADDFTRLLQKPGEKKADGNPRDGENCGCEGKQD